MVVFMLGYITSTILGNKMATLMRRLSHLDIPLSCRFALATVNTSVHDSIALHVVESMEKSIKLELLSNFATRPEKSVIFLKFPCLVESITFQTLREPK